MNSQNASAAQRMDAYNLDFGPSEGASRHYAKFKIGTPRSSEPMDLYSVENCTCFSLRRVTRVITQSFDAEFRGYGIRITQTPILNALQARSGWSMAEMSDFLGMDRTTLLRNLRPLQREGLIKISGGGQGSHVQLAITDKGRAAMVKLLPAWRSAQEKVVAILGEKRWSTILGDLGRVATELKTR